MTHTVRDDAGIGARRIGSDHTGIRRQLRAAPALLLGLLIGQTPLLAQTDSPLSLTVRDAGESCERLIAPLSRTVVVETSAPIARAQAVDSSIANVQAISPRSSW